MVRSKKATAAPIEPATAREVRDWARKNGHEVADRGRLSRELVDAFTAATGRPIVSNVSAA